MSATEHGQVSDEPLSDADRNRDDGLPPADEIPRRVVGYILAGEFEAAEALVNAVPNPRPLALLIGLIAAEAIDTTSPYEDEWDGVVAVDTTSPPAGGEWDGQG